VSGDDPERVHQAFAEALDGALDEIRAAQQVARDGGVVERPRWPMSVLRTPKGWAGPSEVDGVRVEGTLRSHEVPLSGMRENPSTWPCWRHGCAPTAPRSCSTRTAGPRRSCSARAPEGVKRMGASPHANGGELLRDLRLPDFRDYAVDVRAPTRSTSEAMRVLGGFMRDVTAADPESFRVFGPDETASNRLGDVLEVTDRAWLAEREPGDDHLARDGRVMEVLSEHLCQGWLEGYLLTGRHGVFKVGERAPAIRAGAAQRLAFLGVALDDAANRVATGDADLGTPGAAVRVAVIGAREDVEMARQARTLLGSEPP
jgi:xylulose-5-phosphate/fructose-6-phosphate phosphoketolase